ncbi:MAG: pre-mRNA 3-end-processing factor fip1l1 [Bathelium mastoideum]|nr:MAG: pre-mRNA 3-end-processing factor fip1l1 [Bathelium mastoideum]
MDEEDDDLYMPDGSAGNVGLPGIAQAVNPGSISTNGAAMRGVKNEDMEDVEEDDDDSDSDIDIIVEKKDGTVEPPQSRRRALQSEAPRPASERPSQTPAPPKQTDTALPSRIAGPTKSGASYPEVRTSTVDVEPNPIHQPTGKPITEVDIDAGSFLAFVSSSISDGVLSP